MPKLLTSLDAIEGTASGLFTRQLRNIAGQACWVYMAGSIAGVGEIIDVWRGALHVAEDRWRGRGERRRRLTPTMPG